jgi:DNA-binding transcriptional LysR family regulator
MHRYIALQKIVELGSFAKAAYSLGYTQSALSQAISSLESDLGFKVLKRSRTGSTLTNEGEEIYPYIKRAIFQYQSSVEKAKDIRNLDTGVIRIGTMSSISVNWLPSLINEFHQLHPNVEFITQQGDYSVVNNMIKTGEVHFGFVSPDAISGVEIVPLTDGPLVAIVPKGHPLAEYDVIPLKELMKESFILLATGYYSECLNAFKEHNIKPDIKYTVHDDYTIMAMVEQGMGVSILAELILHRANFDIEVRPIDPPLKRTLAIGYRSKLELPVAARKFVEFIAERRNSLP